MEDSLNMNPGQNILEALAAEPKNLWKRILIFAVVLAIAAWGATSVDFNGITQSGAKIAGSVINGIMHPNTELLFNLTTDGVPFLVLQTIAIAILGTIFGALLAIPISFLSATNIVPRPVAMIFRAIVLFIRTIPSLMWALIWIRVTGPGAFCGVVTQSICSIGMVSKMYVTAIENLDTGILESLDAAGCNTFEKIRVGVLPQLLASFISTAIYRFDINLKDATTLGIVGAGGIGSPLVQSISSAKYHNVGAFLWALIILVVIIEWLSTKIRTRLAHGRQ
ncbi:MAG: phosphonate ABC transporter, permease protein PhnE [Atopobiaceae bacterium]|nr:phosphonate ABC transporter, permease protein PhnE [Atopobiaceae bacterium]